MAHTTPNANGFDDLTPSAKLVYVLLQRESPLTQSELVERTQLSARTVRNGLEQLERADLASKDVCLRDARKRVYSSTANAE